MSALSPDVERQLPVSDFSEGFVRSLCCAPNPVYATDAENRISAWNGATEELLGHRAEDAIGKLCYRLIAGTDNYGNDFCGRECAVMRMVRHNRAVKQFEIDVSRAGGDKVRTRCTILAIPEPFSRQLYVVHLLEQVEKPAKESSGKSNPGTGDLLPVRPGRSGCARLTNREQQVLRLLATGAGTRAVSDALFISPTTVRTHIRNLLEKLNAHSRLEAVLSAFQHRLL